MTPSRPFSIETPDVSSASKPMLWTGCVLSTLFVLFMGLDGVMKLAQPAPVVESFHKLGYNPSISVGLGLVLLTCTLLYALPRTAVLGAVLLTGYLGGAVATHVRVGASAFEILFPVVFGAIAWGGIWLRDARIRALLPLRSA